MSFISLRVIDLVYSKYVGTWPTQELKVVLDEPFDRYFNKEHTYLVVFGPTQFKEQEVFEKEFAKHIIFKSRKACNTNHKGSGPRNTLFIFERNDDGDAQVNAN